MEDSKLKEKIGKTNPFKVPDGYFESFTDKLMEQLPDIPVSQTQEITTWQRVKPWVYMAAMFGGLMFGLKTMKWATDRDMPQQSIERINLSTIPEEEIDPMVQQTMMDDYELYEYITEADANHKTK